MVAFSPVSLVALAVIVAAIVVAATKRFGAAGSFLIANLIVFVLSEFGPTRAGILGAAGSFDVVTYSTIQAELGVWTPHVIGATALGAVQLLSSMFVHADVFHLLGNMLFLFFFGVAYEERVGHRRFLLVYLLGGVLGSILQAALDMGSPHLGMGASGAIAALMGAFVVRFPNQVVRMPVPLGIISMILPVRVVVGVLAFLAFQVAYVLMAITGITQNDNTGYAAHFGGLAAGLVLGRILVKPGRAAGPVPVDLKALEPFARDVATRQVLTHMQSNHDEPAVFQAWLDRFFRTATCPTCGEKVAPRSRGEIVCTQNHRFDVRQGKPADTVAKPA